MTDLRTAAQQALEALEWHYARGHSNTLGGLRLKIDEKALRNLKAALAQNEPPAEPVAVVRSVVGQGDDGVRIKWLSGFPQIGDRLYTAPIKRTPLTDAEIEDIWSRFCDELGEASINDAIEIARAIEQAHGTTTNERK